MIQLTAEQRPELSLPEPVAMDPETKATYVLVPFEVYQRMKALLADNTQYTTADLLDRVMADDDARDPYLAELQKNYNTGSPHP